MDEATLLATVTAFIAEEAGVSTTSIDPDANLFALGVMDSLMIVMVVALAQEELDVAIDIAKLTEDNVRSVRLVARLIQSAPPAS